MSGSGVRFSCLASTKITVETLGKDAEVNVQKLEHGSSGTGPLDVSSEYDDSENSEHASECADEERIGGRKLEDGEVSDTDSGITSETESESASDSSSSASGSHASLAFAGAERSREHVSCIQEAQLSPDGTCIFTTDYDRTFSVYPLDNDLLNETDTRSLKPYAQFSSADPMWSFAPNPLFDLNNASTTTVLVSRRDQYITLHNALWDTSLTYDPENYVARGGPVDISTKLASYKLIDHLTEAVCAPISLAYAHDGCYFYAGHQNSVAVFDASFSEDPLFKIPTIPSARSKLKGGGRGFKGYISALSLSPPSSSSNTGMLAAGARTRYVGLYDSVSGQEVTHFALPGTLYGKKSNHAALRALVGDGVSHMKWSPCGTYLYIAERQSDAILVYDARNFSFALSYCSGRAALTNQKLGFDLWGSTDPYGHTSHEIWAGGTDGKVRVWKDPCLKEGAVEVDEVLEAGEGPVVASLVHPDGRLAVVASGACEFPADDGDTRRRGKPRGGGYRPRFNEWGCLDVLGLGSFE